MGPRPNIALNAAQYLAAYVKSMPDLLDESLRLSSRLSSDPWTLTPMIPTAALLSAWPGEPFEIGQNDNAHDAALGDSARQLQSLREKSFAEVLNRAWKSDPNDLSWLNEARLLPDLHERIIKALHDKPGLIFESSGMVLFALATRGHNETDLTYFHGLTSQMLENLLKQIDQDRPRQLHLTLPCMRDLTTEHIVGLIQRHRIDSLHLGYTKSISGEEAYAVAMSQPALTLTHPSFFREAVDAENMFNNSEELNPLLEFKPRARSPLVQILYAHSGFGTKITHLQDGGVVWSEAIREVSPYDDNKGGARILPLPLADAVLPLAELIAILPGALHKILNDVKINFSSPMVYAPRVAGVAKALTVDPLQHCIEPLAKAKAIEMGSWSLLICVGTSAQGFKNILDNDPKDPFGPKPVGDFKRGIGNKFRYAFVTKDTKEEVVAVDALEFLRQVHTRQIPEDYDSLAYDFVKDLFNMVPGKPAATLCCQAEAAEVVKAAEIYNGHIDAWEKEMARMIRNGGRQLHSVCFQYRQRMEHPANEPQNEPRMLFLRSIHQAKATGKTFCVPNWFEFFVLDKTKDQLAIALSTAIREVTDLAKKVPSAARVTIFWEQLSGPFLLDQHLFELAAEYICILLSLACVTVIRLRQKIHLSAKAHDQARYEAKRSTPDIYADVADSPLEHCVRRFIDTIEQGSGIVTLGPPTWRDIAILSGTYINLTTLHSGVSAQSLQSLWTTENLLRQKFQDEPDELLAPKTSHASHLSRFYSMRWKPLVDGGAVDYRHVATTRIGKRSVRSTWQLIHAACADLEDLGSWLRVQNGGDTFTAAAAAKGRGGGWDFGEERLLLHKQSRIHKLQKEREREKEKEKGGFLGGAVSTVAGMKSKAAAAGGRLRFGPFKIKSVAEMV
ncbi:uncharacterized protein MYCFIDRAFT_195144 [Pseudocercospora fijiensis CIRAD86]|uniref:Uncharacterized protein n=1 Tax=Pseudocercospora fijiensis (strain CIRAD86) TaxID=383855 RepID=M3B3K8_PSEFD|nr:uncharacterized protein MYCFIDRAFT_195144 [Pseudocercospora fijiensis CIRAD86]EME83957.1 hypothetical protein MYCFIDRAFT_195144 [Pseudocercospora fijiensis CIRAD86]